MVLSTTVPLQGGDVLSEDAFCMIDVEVLLNSRGDAELKQLMLCLIFCITLNVCYHSRVNDRSSLIYTEAPNVAHYIHQCPI